MIPITKQDIIKAFQANKMKRNKLLYEYYKDLLFDKGLTAEYIADKISEDLGIKITSHVIYNINKRIINSGVQSPALPATASSTPSSMTAQNLKGKKGADPGQGSKVWEFKNADEYPEKDAFGGALDNL